MGLPDLQTDVNDAPSGATDPLAGLTTFDWADAVAPETAPKPEAPKRMPQASAGPDITSFAAVHSDAPEAPSNTAPPERREAPVAPPTPALVRQPADRIAPQPPSRRGGLASVVLVLLGATLIVAVAVARVASATGDDAVARLAAANRDVARSEARLAGLATETAGRERTLADLQRQIDARNGDLTERMNRLVAIEKRRAELVAELDGGPDEAEASILPDAAADEPLAPAPKPAAAPAGPGVIAAVPQNASVEPETSPEVAAVAAAPEDTAATGGPLRVFIHVQASEPGARERARALADELKRRGMTVADIRNVPRAVRRDAMRYFHDADKASLAAVADAIRKASQPGAPPPVSQDFTGFGAPLRAGTVEIWLS